VSLWGGSFVAVDLALGRFEPFTLTATRLALGALVLAAIQRARRRPLLPRPEDRARCVLLGVTLAAHLSIQAFGLLYTSSVHTGWIIGFTPITTALGAQFVLKRPLHALGWGGVAIATIGVWIVTLEHPAELVNASFGDALQLVTCVTWAVYTLAGARAVEGSGVLRVAASSMAVASAILYLGILCNAVAFVLWYHAQRVHGVHRTAATLYLEPFVTLVVAMALLGERFRPSTALGGVIVLAGVWCVGRGQRAAAR